MKKLCSCLAVMIVLIAINVNTYADTVLLKVENNFTITTLKQLTQKTLVISKKPNSDAIATVFPGGGSSQSLFREVKKNSPIYFRTLDNKIDGSISLNREDSGESNIELSVVNHDQSYNCPFGKVVPTSQFNLVVNSNGSVKLQCKTTT